MELFLWIGSILGALVGLAHGIQIYRSRADRVFASASGGGKFSGAYYGLWAFGLWTIFGAYVLTFWVLGSVAYSISRLMPQRGAAA